MNYLATFSLLERQSIIHHHQNINFTTLHRSPRTDLSHSLPRRLNVGWGLHISLIYRFHQDISIGYCKRSLNIYRIKYATVLCQVRSFSKVNIESQPQIWRGLSVPITGGHYFDVRPRAEFAVNAAEDAVLSVWVYELCEI